jgi:acyl-CoA reductase-like NAD-dependent aldehyde dehydrogenase
MIDTQNAIFEVTNPVTGEVIGRVPKASSGEVEMVVERAREAQKRWGTWHIEERCRVLRQFGDLMWRHQQEAMDVIRRETGKSWTDAYGEITGVDEIGRASCRERV